MADIQETLAISPPKLDETNVPDLIKVGQIESNMAMDVTSDVLDPIVCNDTSCRFVFQNKGYLHDGSRITLAVKKNASTTDGAFFPLGVGCHSLIRRATLRVGGQTVCEIEDYNFFKSYESMFISNEMNKDREAVMSGRQICHEFVYNNSAGSQSNSAADAYGLDTGVEPFGGQLKNRVYTDINNEPTFSVTLGELFPFMKGKNLPLFAMKQEVMIDLVWEPLSSTGRVSVDANASTGTQFSIDTTKVKLVADYIFYDGAVMAQRLQQFMSKPTQFVFNDYRLTKTSLSVEDAKNSVRNLGGAGRIVTKVITGIHDDNRTDRYILNKYSAVAPARDYINASVELRKNGTLTTNIRMNDFFVFPIDLSNSAVLFDKTARAARSFPFVTREEYCAEGDVLTSEQFHGTAQNGSTGLLGNFFFQSYKLPVGRINSRGLELTTKCDALPTLGAGQTYTQRTYIEIEKVAELRDGFLTVGFS
jgi:hypothetical protein